MFRNLSINIYLCLGLLPGGCSESPVPPRESVALQLKWYHQAQFVGFYMAKVGGLYDTAGLDVQIIEGGKDMDPIEEVSTKKAQFGISGSEAVAVAAGNNSVAVAAIFQRNPMVFFTMPDR